MKSYPNIWGLFQKPWNKDPVMKNKQDDSWKAAIFSHDLPGFNTIPKVGLALGISEASTVPHGWYTHRGWWFTWNSWTRMASHDPSVAHLSDQPWPSTSVSFSGWRMDIGNCWGEKNQGRDFVGWMIFVKHETYIVGCFSWKTTWVWLQFFLMIVWTEEVHVGRVFYPACTDSWRKAAVLDFLYFATAATLSP